MKVAVIGRGKTGSAVINCLGQDQVQGVYSSENPATVENLKGAEVAIIFVAASVFEQSDLFDVLLQAKIPVICATTGFSWSDEHQANIRQAGASWIVANNFSLSMVLIKKCVSTLGKMTALVDDVSFKIHEVHHVHKVDSPSGTAMSWNEWSGQDCEISADRVEDVNGIHEMTVASPFETVTLKHHAHTRDLFAQGAIWAAKQLLASDLTPGLTTFDSWVEKKIGDL